MGLLSTIKERIFGRRKKPPEKPEKRPEGKPEEKPAAELPQAKPVVRPSDVSRKDKVEVVQKEEKPVAEKISIGELHLSGCTGCLVTLADNYEGLFKLLDDYADLAYALTLVDVRHVPEMDVCLVEGSCCLDDKLSVEELKEARAKSKVLVAYGGCAAYGNITRFCRGGQ